jgi:magnesium transporter
MAMRVLECPRAVLTGAGEGEVRRLAAGGGVYWLDVEAPGQAELQLLAELFGLHPLALEDSSKFGQRPKVEEYDDLTVVVAHGVGADGDPVEVHCIVAAAALVTLHRAPAEPLDELAVRFDRHGHAPARPAALLHGVLDVLTDSFFPALADIDGAFDAIDQELLEDPGGRLQAQIFALKRRLMELGRVAGPMRDVVGRLASGVVRLHGQTDETDRYFRDVYDHLLRVEDVVEQSRDLLTGATEVHLSAISNRLNGVMKQLTLIATVFLPLTFLTGFFGQNFPWMIENLGGPGPFLLYGVGLQVATVAALLMLFRRRGWL